MKLHSLKKKIITTQSGTNEKHKRSKYRKITTRKNEKIKIAACNTVKN